MAGSHIDMAGTPEMLIPALKVLLKSCFRTVWQAVTNGGGSQKSPFFCKKYALNRYFCNESSSYY